mmetsp:Transcript_3927/g.13152  ORF Transcript_3927/g.13152 Transcript_3927/m.13152 type:complete len:238 (-) Transcript_3927:724-1437(-)
MSISSLAPKSLSRTTVASPAAQYAATYPRPDVDTDRPDNDPGTDPRAEPATEAARLALRGLSRVIVSPLSSPSGVRRAAPPAEAGPSSCSCAAPSARPSAERTSGAAPGSGVAGPAPRGAACSSSQSSTTKLMRCRLVPRGGKGLRQYCSAVTSAAAPEAGSTRWSEAPIRETSASGGSDGATPFGRRTRSSRQRGAISTAQTCRTLDVPVLALADTSDDDALHLHGASAQTPSAKR